MAGDVEFTFGSNLDGFLPQLRGHLQEVLAAVRETAGTVNSIEFGDRILVDFRETMAKVVAEARATQARIKDSTITAIGGATSTAGYRAPAAGNYQTQDNAALRQTISTTGAVYKAYAEQFPRLANQFEAESHKILTEDLAVRKRVREADLRDARTLASAQSAAGIKIPRADVTATGAINGQAAINDVFNANAYTAADQRAYGAEVRTAREQELAALRRRAVEEEKAATATAEDAAATKVDAEFQRRSAAALKGANTKRLKAAEAAAAAAGGGGGGGPKPPVATGGFEDDDLSREAHAARIRLANETARIEAANEQARKQLRGTAGQDVAPLGLQPTEAEREAGQAAVDRAEEKVKDREKARELGTFSVARPPVSPTKLDAEEEAQQKRGQLEATAARLDLERAEAQQALAQKWGTLEEQAARIDLERAQKQAEQADRALLVARKAEGSAEALPGRLTRTSEGDFYRNTAGNRAVQLQGPELAEAEADYVKRLQARAQQEGTLEQRAYNADQSLTDARNRAAQQLGTTQVKAQKVDDELANASYVAKNYTQRAGSLYQTPAGVFQETQAGAKQVTSELELIRANETLILARQREAALEARAQPKGFIGSFVQAATSRSAFSGGAGGEQVPVLDKLGGRFGSLSETFAGFAVLGIAIKAIADTKAEVVAYTTAMTNLEVVTGRTDVATASFTNDLEGLSRLAGSNVSDQIDAATRTVAAFGDASTQSAAQLQALGEKGATAASILAVNSGTTLKVATNNLIAAGTSFGLTRDSFNQITDAAQHAQKAPLGGERDVITEALAYGAETFKAAGYNPQQAADIASLGTARTNESGQAYATKFATITQLFGSHQDTLQGLGVDTSGTFKDQLEQLAAIYPKLTAAEQKHTVSQLAGRSAQRELLPLLKEQAKLQQADSENDAGAGAAAFAKRNETLAGLFRKIAGDVISIELNLSRTGIFSGIGVALKVLEPGLKTLSDLLGLVDRLLADLGPLGKLPGLLIDTYLALKLLAAVGRLPLAIGAAVPSLARTGPLPGFVTSRTKVLGETTVGRIVAPGNAGATEAAAGANAAGAEAATADATANSAAAKAKLEHAAANKALAASEGAAAAGSSRSTVAADADATANSAAAAAKLENVAANEALVASGQLEFEATVAILNPMQLEIVTRREVRAAILAEDEARAGQISLFDAEVLAQNAGATAAAAATRAALEEAAALEKLALAEAEVASGQRGFLGIGNRISAARSARSAGAAAGEGEAAAGAGGAGKAGIAAAALIGADIIFSGFNNAAKKTKASLDDTATAMDALRTALTPEDIDAAAAQFRSAAAERDQSTAGFFGSIKGFFDKYLIGSGDSNKEAQNLRDAAVVADAVAKHSADVQKKNADLANPGVFEGAPNSPDAITKAFKLMDEAGESAAQKIDALTLALDGVPDQGQGPGHILPGAANALGISLGKSFEPDAITALSQVIQESGFGEKTLGQAHDTISAQRPLLDKIAKKLTTDRTLTSDIDTSGKLDRNGNDIDQLFPTLDSDRKSKSALADPKKVADLHRAVGTAVEDRITALGLDSGGVISDADATDLAKTIANFYVNDNLNPKQLAATRAKIAAEKKKEILDQTDSTKIKPTQVESQVQQALGITLSQQAGVEKLAETGGDKVAAAQAVLQRQNQFNSRVLRDGLKITTQALAATQAAQYSLANSLQERANALADAATNLRPADDAVGRAQDALTKAKNKLLFDTRQGPGLPHGTPEQVKADESDIVARARDTANAKLDVREAGILAAVPENNAGAAATAAVRVATLELRKTSPGTKEYLNATKVLERAKYDALQQRIADAETIASGGLNFNDSTAGLRKEAGDKKKVWTDLIASGHAGAAEVAKALQEANAAAFAAAKGQLEDDNAILESTINWASVSDINAKHKQEKQNTVNLYKNFKGVDGKAAPVKGQAYSNAVADLNQANFTSGGGLSADQAANDAADAAVKVGDSYGEAYTQYLDMVRTANTKVGAERAKLLRDAAVQKVVAEKLAVDIAHGARVNAIDPRDELALAREALRNDKAAQGVAGQPTEQLAQEVLQGKQDALAVQQAEAARNAAKLTSQVRQGDPLSGAAAALTIAKDNLKLDEVGTLKYFQDLAAVKQAAVAYAQAFRDRARENLLLAGDTTDPLTQARADLVSATAKLEDDKRKKTGDLRQDQINKETAAQALQKAQFDQQLQQQQTAYGLGQESSATFLKFLHDTDSSLRSQLAGMKKGQEGYQQLVDELNTVDQAIQSANNQLSGQFNLGDIKLPTVYEVRRQVASSAAGQNIDASASTVVNNVNINGADFAAVVAYITSILGNRGGSTVATTGRKAA